MSKEYSFEAINAALHGELTFCKFLSANDTGLTGGHQAGIYISRPAIPILFDKPGAKGENKDRWVTIHWQDGIKTHTRFIYYGVRTRNEYRITNFGREFPFLQHEYTGALFVFVKNDEENYQGFVLNTEDEINNFLAAFAISPTETNQLIDTKTATPEIREKSEIAKVIAAFTEDFPSSEVMSASARRIQEIVHNNGDYIRLKPDQKLLDWTEMEFKLFRAVEFARYGKIISQGFSSLEDFITLANQVLNRRKSRAGKSLEHHLAAIFDGNELMYEAQVVTEGNKKPDFLFPSQTAYRNPSFNTEKLITLAAKTTCKDRWRQILNEANRLRDHSKYLCTLQQGISSAQMDEMAAEHVVLVVPGPYIRTYPADRRDRIWTVKKFVEYVREIER